MRSNRARPAHDVLQCLPVHAAFALAVVALLLRDLFGPAWSF